MKKLIPYILLIALTSCCMCANGQDSSYYIRHIKISQYGDSIPRRVAFYHTHIPGSKNEIDYMKDTLVIYGYDTTLLIRVLYKELNDAYEKNRELNRKLYYYQHKKRPNEK